MPYKIRITVISVTGECSEEHKIGDSWLIGEGKTPVGICGDAYNCIFPYISVLRFGGEFPWTEDKDAACFACPDSDNPVVFELWRLRENR